MRQEDFTKAKLPETFELAIGNPPFSDRTVRSDDPSGKLGLSLHEYFMARLIERLKPGGLAAFVCSRYAMDRIDPKSRAHIASKADLVGAVRMPQAAMMAASGTEVVVDLLFFQRRAPGQEPGGAAWDELGLCCTGQNVGAARLCRPTFMGGGRTPDVQVPASGSLRLRLSRSRFLDADRCAIVARHR